VAVPEAPVDKDDGFIAWQHHIRLARQSLDVQPVSKPCAVQHSPHNKFRLGVGAFNTPHDLATLLAAKGVHKR